MLRRYSGLPSTQNRPYSTPQKETITITISEADTNTVRVPVTGIIFIPISIEYTEFPTVVAKGLATYISHSGLSFSLIHTHLYCRVACPN
jgi:hypothetical protein